VDKHIKCDLKRVEKPDSIFHDKLLGKGSKVFKHLELGTLPVVCYEEKTFKVPQVYIRWEQRNNDQSSIWKTKNGQ